MAPPSRCNANSWTFEQERILIDFFEANTFLWNVNDKDHMNRAMKVAALQNCVSLLGTFDATGEPFFIESLKGKFTNLRTSYQRELKRVEESRRSGNVYTPKWNHYEHLAFLRDAYRGAVDSSSIATNSGTTGQCHGVSPLDKVKFEQVAENGIASGSSGRSNPKQDIDSVRTLGQFPAEVASNGTASPGVQRRVTRKRSAAAAAAAAAPQPTATAKRRGLSELLAILRKSAARTEDSPEDVFGKHVASSLKSMPSQYNRERTKLEIQKILHQHMIEPD